LLLDKQLAFLAEEDDRAWGFAGVQVEERPATLPQAAPTRAHLRALALEYGHPPAQAVPTLLQPILQELRRRSQPTQWIVYGGEPWLTDTLPPLGFTLSERVQFFRLDHLQRYAALEQGSRNKGRGAWGVGTSDLQSKIRNPKSEIVQLRPMHPDDIEVVARLDAEAFDPLWHFGAKELWELLFTCRTQVAFSAAALVGYAAVATGIGDAHLTRIAVHPAWQGRGIGQQLLADAIEYARSNRARTLSLNTQISNERSQRLYLGFGFQPTRQIVPVFTQVIQPIS
jgi:ribosomal-protein-alanine N-acetyltransferase